MLLAAPLPAQQATPAGQLDIAVTNLRSAKGVVRLCLTRDPRHFPRCQDDPAALRLSAPAGKAATLSFAAVPPGHYAIAAFHDENGNSKLDTFAKIPREGFGFSRNPPIRFGPPRFSEARISVGQGIVRQIVRLNYIL
ncbi:MAG TPA: DUF2141 domain-containing protein [Sphingomicrobium sp.]|nr:DUF2141 domain-containing protein [Sphingomicrobium sp.]